jgi:hypothetical protein
MFFISFPETPTLSLTPPSPPSPTALASRKQPGPRLMPPHSFLLPHQSRFLCKKEPLCPTPLSSQTSQKPKKIEFYRTLQKPTQRKGGITYCRILVVAVLLGNQKAPSLAVGEGKRLLGLPPTSPRALYQGTTSVVPLKVNKDMGFSPWVRFLSFLARAVAWKQQQKAVPQRLKPRVAERFTARLKPCPSCSEFFRSLFSPCSYLRGRFCSLGEEGRHTLLQNSGPPSTRGAVKAPAPRQKVKAIM